MIELRNITPKPIKRYGVVHNHVPDNGTVYNADIEPGKSIRLFGINYHKPFDITFKVGDIAEYSSYNLHYLGTITQITAKTVTINEKDSRRDGKVHRLSLHEFSWRNYKFDFDKITADNHDTMQYI